MKNIFLLFILLISFDLYSLPNPNSFKSTYLSIENLLINSRFTKSEEVIVNRKYNDFILNDENNLINDTFVVSNYFKSSYDFWFSIYTQYTSKEVVFHDKDNLKLIYKAVDFSQVHNSAINIYAKDKLHKKLKKEFLRKMKLSLRTLSTKSFKSLNNDELELTRSIKKVFKIPLNKKKKKIFFMNLANNLRTQTGQRDMIKKGVIRSLPYFEFMLTQIKNFSLPKELLSIPFLESSFNVKAYSKVAAVGIWQFMPFTGSLFMPKRSKYFDYRKNPFISTLAALHLLKQNKLILKRWDLAIPAYNSGTKHFVKARRKYNNVKNLNLEFILKNYKSSHIGFASKNFYSEFLALSRALAYKELIYPIKSINTKISFKDVSVYISKCSIPTSKFFTLLKNSSPHIRTLNLHVLKKSSIFKRGSIIISDISLSKRKYLKLSNKQLKSVFPKKYYTYIKNKRCGKL